MEKDDVTRFLHEFKMLSRLFGVYFFERAKNDKALLELDISRRQRMEVIMSLCAEDYVSGPSENLIQGMEGDVWVFGKHIKRKECYIKICINNGRSKKYCVCISFHVAEHKLKHIFKNNN